MNWKDGDLDNIVLNNSKAISSSISQWSKPADAYRPILENPYIEKFAFHTGRESNPWWMLELDKEYNVDIIKIVNRKDRYRERLKSIEVFISSDAINWIKIDSDMYDWSTDLSVLEIGLYSSFSFRYIKIMLNDINKTYLHFLKIELYCFKNNGFVISSRTDGFGMRMINMLIGMYLAQKLNFSFGFTWRNENPDIVGIYLDSAECIFSKEFIEKFLYKSDNNLIKEHVVETAFFNTKDLSKCCNKTMFSEKWGYYSPSINFGLPYEYLNGISKDDFFCDIGKIFKHVGFSSKLNNIFELAYRQADIIGDFSAIHIRNGEVVYDNICKTYLLQLWLGDRYFPYELALEICLQEISRGKKIVIFGQDSQSNEKLYQILNEKYPNCVKLAEILSGQSSDFEKSFFEVILMSRASKIFTSGKIKANSAFSILASFIAGKYNLLSYNECFSDQEQYDIIKKNYIFFNNNHKLQLAMINFRMFQLSLKLSLDFNEKIFYLQRALENDPENNGYRIYILDLFFKNKKYEDIELMIKNDILDKVDLFLNTIFINRLSERKVYEWHSKSYLLFPYKEKYPYISHISALIAYRLNIFSSAVIWNTYSLRKLPKEKHFIKFAKQLRDN
ncbi:TPA: discoidin domain-containing protein [Campylobacter lari]|nr:discoidin domain-containing protein [Campylobacter lari]HEC1812655.1 discoidin domain-containing protein [Campylobacter lari]